MKLDLEVASSEGRLYSCGDLQTCVVVFADEGRASRRMPKFFEHVTKLKGFNNGESKCNIFCCGCRFGYNRLQLAAVTDCAASEAESVSTDCLP